MRAKHLKQSEDEVYTVNDVSEEVQKYKFVLFFNCDIFHFFSLPEVLKHRALTCLRTISHPPSHCCNIFLSTRAEWEGERKSE